MTNYYTRQHTFINGVTADGTEVEDEFVAIDAAFDTVSTEVDAATVTANAAAASAAAAAISAAESAAAAGVSTISTDTTITVGTGGTYATLAAAINYLYTQRVKPGIVIRLNLLANVTETTEVWFPTGMILEFASNGAARTVTGTCAGSGRSAFNVPKGCDLRVAGSYGVVLDTSNSAGGATATLRNEGDIYIGQTLTLKATGSNVASQGYLLYSFGGSFYAPAAGGDIIISDDAYSGAAFVAGKIIGGNFHDVTFATAGAEPILQVDFEGASVHTDLAADSPTHRFSGCNASIRVSGTNTFVRRLLTADEASDVCVEFSGSHIIDMGGTNKFIEVVSSSLVVEGATLDFQSNPSLGADAYIIHATRSRVITEGCDFTAAAGDYALYGIDGSTLYGSGNSYTTLTSSNLNSTWAVNGQFLDA